jgi:hypothetical protein
LAGEHTGKIVAGVDGGWVVSPIDLHLLRQHRTVASLGFGEAVQVPQRAGKLAESTECGGVISAEEPCASFEDFAVLSLCGGRPAALS